MHTLSLFSFSAWVAPRLAAVRQRIAEGLRRRRAHREARLTEEAVERLDDRTLRDLGLCRSDAGAIGAELHGLRRPTLRRVIQVI